MPSCPSLSASLLAVARVAAGPRPGVCSAAGCGTCSAMRPARSTACDGSALPVPDEMTAS